MTMRTYERSFDRLRVLSASQFGLVTTAQMEKAGFDRSARTALVARGWVQRVRSGVYRLPGAQTSWRASAAGAVLAAGGDAALSHFSAAALWELMEPDELEGRVDITSARMLRLKGVVSHRQPFVEAEITRRYGFRVTSVERTLLDVSEGQSAHRVGRLIDDAVRRRLTTTARVAGEVERRRRRGERRLRPIREALALRGAGYDPGANDWERRMDDLWEQMGLPPSERQATITLPGGRRVRPDRVIWDIKLAVEWNGFAWHGLRSDFESDIERRNLLQRAGWTVIEFHSRQSPQEICETVLEVCGRLRSAMVPAS